MPIVKTDRRAAFAACAWLLTSGMQSPPWSPGQAMAAGPCRAGQLCSFTNPEDIADLRGSDWLIVSQQSASDPSIGLAALDVRSHRIVQFAQNAFGPSCIPDARGGGIGVRRERRGYRLVRIVHRGGYGAAVAQPDSADGVETYRIQLTRNGPRIERTGCIVAPLPLFLNDIAPLPDGGFVATHMFDRSVSPAAREASFLAGRNTGHVLRWSSGTGWRAVAGSGGVFPNGLDVSGDGRRIAFAEIYGHAVNLMPAAGGRRQRVAITMNPDNVTWLTGNKFLVAGGTGVPIASTRGCGAYRAAGCAFPSAAIIADFARLRSTTVVRSIGAQTPGFSVAVHKNGRYYVGGSSGNRITAVRAGRAVPTLP